MNLPIAFPDSASLAVNQMRAVMRPAETLGSNRAATAGDGTCRRPRRKLGCAMFDYPTTVLLAHAVRFRTAFAVSYGARCRRCVLAAAVVPFGDHFCNRDWVSSPSHRLVSLSDIASLVCQCQILGSWVPPRDTGRMWSTSAAKGCGLRAVAGTGSPQRWQSSPSRSRSSSADR